MKRRLAVLMLFVASTAEAGRLLAGTRSGSPPPSPSPAGQAPETPLVNYASSPASQAGRIDHVVVAPDQLIDGTAIGSAITYRTYRGTTYSEVVAGADGPLTPTTSSSTTYTATGLSAGTHYVMTPAVVDSIEGPGQVRAYTVT